MNILETLKYLGLENRESAVYLANLEIGVASAREIANKANLQRTYFYDISEKLIKRGIIRQIKKGKKKLFVAVEPDRLIEIQEKQLEIAKSLLPQLKAIRNTFGEKPRVYFFEGKDGINQINNDTLQYKDEIVGFTTPRFLTADDEKLSKEYISKRVARGLKARVVGEISNEMIKIKKRDKEELRETRMLPKNLFNSQVEVGMYGNRCYFTNYKDEFGLIIEDSEISKTLKSVFEIIWSSGKIVDKF